jgi:hypothetical protein
MGCSWLPHVGYAGLAYYEYVDVRATVVSSWVD